MSKVFFTSDLHLGHENLCSGLRGMTAEESDRLIINNWNESVSKRDTVYVLGDFVMEKHQLIKNYVKQLNGSIVIVGGNHDNIKCCKEFIRLGIPVMGCLQYKGFMCTHIPIHETEMRDWRGCFHGHIHLIGKIEGLGDYQSKSIQGRYYNVNTELNNYTPVFFGYIEKHFTEKYGTNK